MLGGLRWPEQHFSRGAHCPDLYYGESSAAPLKLSSSCRASLNQLMGNWGTGVTQVTGPEALVG